MIDVKPPGIPTKGLSLRIPSTCSVIDQEVRIEGKWFNYSVLFVILVCNLYQWKNQIYYEPNLYGQYTDINGEKEVYDKCSQTLQLRVF